MKLYVYVDESGTFDKAHNETFVYGGVIVSAKDKKDATDKYIGLERHIREGSNGRYGDGELKASLLSMRDRSRAFKAIASMGCTQFAAVVRQRMLMDSIFQTKYSRQRYLDFALKLAIKRGVLSMFERGFVRKEDVSGMSVVVDEHSTATDGKYSLLETINEEFRYGVHNFVWQSYFPPVFSPDFPQIPVAYVDSSRVALIRAADVTANWVYRAERDRVTYPHALADVSRRIELLRLP